jgi:FlaA1/EpsC-like NDP-sugar epimerase
MDATHESCNRELELMASAAPLRCAVIGSGHWGPNLARNFKASPDWDLAGIVDMDRDRAVKLAAGLGNVPVCESNDELLDTVNVDAVAIATRAHTHHGIALTALRALLRAMDSEMHVEHGPGRAVNGVIRRQADTSAAKLDLGFIAETGLEDGLRELVDWWRPLRGEIAATRVGGVR